MLTCLYSDSTDSATGKFSRSGGNIIVILPQRNPLSTRILVKVELACLGHAQQQVYMFWFQI